MFTDDLPIEGYELWVDRVENGEHHLEQEYDLSDEARTLTVGGLSLGRYYVALWAESQYGSGAGASWSFSYVPSPEVRFTQIASEIFEVSWSQVPGASYYLVWNGRDHPADTPEIRDDGTINASSRGDRVDGVSTVYYISESDLNTFTVKVRVCGFKDVFGYETCSIATEIALTGTLPVVTTEEAGDDWLVLSWDPAPGADYYRCFVDFGSYKSAGTLESNSSCHLWGIGLEAGKTYGVVIESCQAMGGSCSTWTTATVSTRLLAPAPASYPVSVKEVGDTWFRLSWDPPASDAYYSLRMIDKEGALWSKPMGNTDSPFVGLEPDTDYILKVRTCRGTASDCDSWVTLPVSTTPPE